MFPTVRVPVKLLLQVPSPRQNVAEEALVPDPKFDTERLPVTPVPKGKPVALVSTSDEGVPKAGVDRVGLLESTTFPSLSLIHI